MQTSPLVNHGSIDERRESAIAFVRAHLEPLEMLVEEGRFDEATRAKAHRAIAESGLAATNLPARIGGRGLSLFEQVAVQEAIGRLTSGVGLLVWTPADALAAGTPEQDERYGIPAARGERRCAIALTEEHAGSDVRGIRSQATWRGDRYLLSGEKWFVGQGGDADFLIVLAWTTHDEDSRAATLFLVDTAEPGVIVAESPDYGFTSPYSDPVFRFEDVELSGAAVLGSVGGGFELMERWFVDERIRVAARCVGASERLVEEALAWATKREQFGTRIYDFQAVSFPIAEAATETLASRLLTEHAALAADGGYDRKVVHTKAAAAKLYASEAAGRIADSTVQIFGGRGVMRSTVAERLWRQLRVERIWEGTSEIQRLIVSRGIDRRGVASFTSTAPNRLDAIPQQR